MNINALPNRLAALALALADAQLAAARAASGLNPSACAALVGLGVQPGATIADLAAVAGLSHSVMVRTVEALRTAGLVDRRPAADARKAALSLTEDGAARREAILAARADAVETALAALPQAAHLALGHALDAMLVALTMDRAGADRLCRLCDEDACGPDCPVEARARALETGAR